MKRSPSGWIVDFFAALVGLWALAVPPTLPQPASAAAARTRAPRSASCSLVAALAGQPTSG